MFTAYGCYGDKGRFAGSDDNGAPAWRLAVASDDSGWRARIAMGAPWTAAGGEADAETDVTEIELPPGAATLPRLQALAVLDALPAAACLAPGQGAGVPPLTPADQALAKLLPKTLTLFDLEYLPRQKLWRATLRGKARRGARTWRVEATLAPGKTLAPVGACILGQRPEGRGTLLARLQEVASAPKLTAERGETDSAYALSVVKHATTDNLAKGYVAMRYGRELVDPKTAVLPPTNLIGLLTELRSGWAKGMRVYWDVVPRASDQVAGSSLYLSWQRIEAGYGFGYEPTGLWRDSLHVRRLELAPKVGIWSVDARLPIVDDRGAVQAERFRTSNDPSAGLEMSVELAWPRFFVRPWTAFDRSFAAFGEQVSNVSSARFGADAFFQGPRLGLVEAFVDHLSFLLFAFQENLTIEGTGNGFSLGLTTVYGGAGVGISW